MKLLSPTILDFLPAWNKHIYSEPDAHDFCAQNEIITIETDLIDDLGEYKLHRKKSFILLHKFIDLRYRSWVYFHEIGHFILHPMSSARFSDAVARRKIEKEAHFVAAVALIPIFVLKTKNIYEIQDEFGLPRRLILLRKAIFDSYKI